MDVKNLDWIPTSKVVNSVFPDTKKLRRNMDKMGWSYIVMLVFTKDIKNKIIMLKDSIRNSY